MTTDLEDRPADWCYRCGYDGPLADCVYPEARPYTLEHVASVAACRVLRDEEIPQAHTPSVSDAHIDLVAEIGRWLTEYADTMRREMDRRAAAEQRNAS